MSARTEENVLDIEARFGGTPGARTLTGNGDAEEILLIDNGKELYDHLPAGFAGLQMKLGDDMSPKFIVQQFNALYGKTHPMAAMVAQLANESEFGAGRRPIMGELLYRIQPKESLLQALKERLQALAKNGKTYEHVSLRFMGSICGGSGTGVLVLASEEITKVIADVLPNARIKPTLVIYGPGTFNIPGHILHATLNASFMTAQLAMNYKKMFDDGIPPRFELIEIAQAGIDYDLRARLVRASSMITTSAWGQNSRNGRGINDTVLNVPTGKTFKVDTLFAPVSMTLEPTAAEFYLKQLRNLGEYTDETYLPSFENKVGFDVVDLQAMGDEAVDKKPSFSRTEIREACLTVELQTGAKSTILIAGGTFLEPTDIDIVLRTSSKLTFASFRSKVALLNGVEAALAKVLSEKNARLELVTDGNNEEDTIEAEGLTVLLEKLQKTLARLFPIGMLEKTVAKSLAPTDGMRDLLIDQLTEEDLEADVYVKLMQEKATLELEISYLNMAIADVQRKKIQHIRMLASVLELLEKAAENATSNLYFNFKAIDKMFPALVQSLTPIKLEHTLHNSLRGATLQGIAAMLGCNDDVVSIAKALITVEFEHKAARWGGRADEETDEHVIVLPWIDDDEFIQIQEMVRMNLAKLNITRTRDIAEFCILQVEVANISKVSHMLTAEIVSNIVSTFLDGTELAEYMTGATPTIKEILLFVKEHPELSMLVPWEHDKIVTILK